MESQVRFNRVPEKVPQPGQVQQGSGEGSGEGSGDGSGRLWCRARSGSTQSGEGSGEGLGGSGAESGQVQQDLWAFNYLIHRNPA